MTVTAMEQKNHTTEPVLGATPTRITNPFDLKLKEGERDEMHRQQLML